MDKKIPLIAVIGPTASGKTGLAVAIAKKIGGEVVSADSMQIYSELTIGTAKPTEKEMCGIPHHLVGFKSIGAGRSAILLEQNDDHQCNGDQNQCSTQNILKSCHCFIPYL